MATIDKYKIQIDVDGESKVKSLTKSLDGLGTTLAGIGFTAFIANAFRMADAMSDIADATGLTAGYVKGLGNAVQQAGGDMNDVSTIVNKFYQNIDDLANGSDKAIDAFAKLNIEQKDLLKTSRQDILGLTLKRLAEMGPGAERTALGIELFGKAFGKIDPKKLNEILKTQDFAKLDEEIRKAGDAYQAMEDNILALQQAVLSVITPFIGEMENMRLSAEQAEKVIKILGITLGIVFAAKTISLIYETATAIRALAAAAALAGRNPLVKALALGSLAIGGLIAGKNLLEEDTTSAAGKPDTKPSSVASDAAAASTIEASQREKAAKAAARTTQEIIKQNQIANQLQKTINSTIGMESNRAEIIKATAQIEADFANKRLQIQGQINAEIVKGKDANQGIINSLREQLVELDKQEAINKKITLDAIERNRIIQQRIAAIQQEIAILTFNEESQLSYAKRLLMLQEANGEITSKQAQIGTKLAEAENRYLQQKINLTEQLLKAKTTQNEEEMSRLLELISLNKKRYQNELLDIAAVEAAETLRSQNLIKGMEDALGTIKETLTPYKLAQDAILTTWGNISSAIDNFITTSKFNFKDFARSVLQDLAKMIAKALIFKYIFEPIMGALGLSIPGKAAGGPVKGGSPYIVGEKGPELFVPPTSGKIVPNNQLQGSNQGSMTASAGPITNNYNTYNINALDAKSVAQLFAENRKAIFGANKMAEREMSYAGVR